MRIAVIGAGNWGTGLAIMAARAGHEVVVWSRNSKVVDSINGDHTNLVYLTGAQIPETVRATGDFAVALVEAELIILAAPSHATRQILEDMISVLRPGSIIVSATKGIEIETGKRISQVVTDVVNKSFAMRFVCLSGPSFASEVVEKHPTAIVAASEDLEAARAVQAALSFENLRIYTNDDLVGTELGGSVKNVMAIAAGMVAGRDLVLTCTGNLSRNRFVGEELGKGRSLEDIAVGMNEVAEGINTTRAVKKLADRLGVEMPIANEVHAVLYERKPARDAATELMRRPLRVEANW